MVSPSTKSMLQHCITLTAVVISCVCLASPASGLHCLRCTSYHATSSLRERCVNGNLPAVKCGESDSYCITIKYYERTEYGREGSNLALYRDCSPVPLGNTCDVVGSQKTTMCMQTCQSSGCNRT